MTNLSEMNPLQIKQARQSLGLTQAAMAAKMGIIQRKWERWEGGHSPISAEGATLLGLLVEMNNRDCGGQDGYSGRN